MSHHASTKGFPPPRRKWDAPDNGDPEPAAPERLSRSQVAAARDAFWTEYFRQYPNPDIMPEMNELRRQYLAR